MDLESVIQNEVSPKNKIFYMNAYMWNLEKQYRWPYLQSRNREADIENKYMDTKGERGVEGIGRLGLTLIHCVDTVYKIF